MICYELPMSFLLILAFLSLFAAGMADNIRGPLLPEIITTMQISDTSAGLLFSVASTMSIVGGFAGGPILRRFGTLFCLRILIITYAAGYLLIAVAPTYAVILLGSAFYGIGMGALHVVHNVLVAQESTPDKRTRYFNFLHTMYGLASLTSPLIAIQTTHIFGNWQTAFTLMTLLPLSLVMISFLTRAKRLTAKALQKPLPFFKVIRLEPCRFFAFFLSCYVAAELCVSLWLVLFITRLGGYSSMEAAGFLTLFFVGMTLSRLLGGIFLKNRWNRSVLIISSVTGFFSILLGIYHHPFWLSLFAFFGGPIFPVGMSELGIEIPHEVEAATGWVITLLFVAISLSQTAMGWGSDLFSVQVAMHFPAALLLIGLLSLLLRNSYKK